MADREFLLRIVGDSTGAQKALGQVSADAETAKGKFSSTAKVIGGMFAAGAAVQFGKQLVGAASDQEQAWGAVNSVFGDYAKNIHDSAETAAKDVGLAQGEYEKLATLTGALLKNAGVPLDEVASSAQNLTQVGADLSAMYGGTVADAMGAINSALKGEMDPLESFGVSLKATAIESKAVAMGLVDAEGKATDYGKKMATVALIQEQAADAQGTFAKESDTVAGQTQILGAQFKDLQADLGTKLLPTIVELAQVLVGFVEFVSNNQSWLVPLAVAIGAVVLAVKAWTIAQTILNSALLANPVFLVVAAVAGLVALIIVAYKRVDWFREFVDESFAAVLDAIKAVWDWLKDNWPLLLAILTGPFGLAVLAIVKNWDEIKAFFRAIPDALKSALSTVTDVLTYPFRQAWDAIKSGRDGLMDWVRGFPSALNDAWSGLADVITWPFRKAFDLIKWLWNSTVGGFSFKVPSWVPGVGGKGWSIPEMASGGIVTRPTIAMIGEAGPEAVVPLGRGGGMFGMAPVTINVYALTANAEVGRKVYESLREYERTSGKG